MDPGRPDSAMPPQYQQQHQQQQQQQQQEPQALTELNSGTSHGPRSLSSDRAGSDPFQRPPDASGAADGGVWRRDEHDRFMQALETYGSMHTGDEWRHITAFVGTRTIAEVRLHGRQYLQQLVQQLPPSVPASTGIQNDPNRQNYQLSFPKGVQKTRGPSTSKVSTAHMTPVPFNSSSALNAAALEAAQAMLIQTPVAQKTGSAPRRHGGRPKAWTFQEDKTFETALADCVGSKPYSWTKIASSLPGKTAKDVRNRYEKLLGDISSIETGTLRVPEAPAPASSSKTRSTTTPSTLSRRAVPPPPIEVPSSSSSSGKDGALDVFPSSSSTRSSGGGSASAGLGFGMLSPTFLELLTGDGDGDGEDKPALPLTGLMDLPSPLLPPPSLFPSASPCALQLRPKTPQFAAGGAQDKKPATRLDIEIEDAAAKMGDTPRRITTPRIWRDFLAEDFKWDEPSRRTPHAPQARSAAQTARTSPDAPQRDVEMPEASAE